MPNLMPHVTLFNGLFSIIIPPKIPLRRVGYLALRWTPYDGLSLRHSIFLLSSDA